jgi:hypothetical protein
MSVCSDTRVLIHATRMMATDAWMTATDAGRLAGQEREHTAEVC